MDLTKFAAALGQVGGAMLGFDWRRYLLTMAAIAALSLVFFAIGMNPNLIGPIAAGTAIFVAVGLTPKRRWAQPRSPQVAGDHADAAGKDAGPEDQTG